jgi:hypothetical protein
MKKIHIKLESAIRYMMVYSISGVLPLYIVNEFPKSGGTWLGQMLGKSLDLPFPRNCFPALQSSIVHGHYLHPWGMKNVVVLWRDGRDMIISWYHHCLFKNESGRNAYAAEQLRRKFAFKDYEDLQENLPIFIEYCFTQKWPMRFSWADFARSWYNREGVVYTRYEDLRHDTASELQRVVSELAGKQLELEKAAEIAEELSFARQTGRKPGQENKNSFLRKGVVGDWRNHFSSKACEVFDQFAGNELILLGYEQDRAWANTTDNQKARVSNTSVLEDTK